MGVVVYGQVEVWSCTRCLQAISLAHDLHACDFACMRFVCTRFRLHAILRAFAGDANMGACDGLCI